MFLQIETRSGVDPKHGAHAYSEDAHFALLCMSWVYETGDAHQWSMSSGQPLQDALDEIKQHKIHAYDAYFVLVCLSAVDADFEDADAFDVSTLCEQVGLRGGFKRSAREMLGIEKPPNGQYFRRDFCTLPFAVPNGENFNAFLAFNRSRAYLLRDLYFAIKAEGLPTIAQDFKARRSILSRGIAIDQKLLESSSKSFAKHIADLRARWAAKYGGVIVRLKLQGLAYSLKHDGPEAEKKARREINRLRSNPPRCNPASPNDRAILADALGYPMPSWSAPAIDEALDDEGLPCEMRECLLSYRAMSEKSVRAFDDITARLSFDGRLRGHGMPLSAPNLDDKHAAILRSLAIPSRGNVLLSAEIGGFDSIIIDKDIESINNNRQKSLICESKRCKIELLTTPRGISCFSVSILQDGAFVLAGHKIYRGASDVKRDDLLKPIAEHLTRELAKKMSGVVMVEGFKLWADGDAAALESLPADGLSVDISYFCK